MLRVQQVMCPKYQLFAHDFKNMGNAYKGMA